MQIKSVRYIINLLRVLSGVIIADIVFSAYQMPHLCAILSYTLSLSCRVGSEAMQERQPSRVQQPMYTNHHIFYFEVDRGIEKMTEM